MDVVYALLEAYGRVVHAPLVLFLCISGAVGHLITVATLTSMVNPTNVFLVSMSCCQLMLCANFLYSTLFKYASDELCSPYFFSFYAVKTMHISVTLAVLVHMAGVFHVVALSLIRYFSLVRLSKINSNIAWFSYEKCRWTIVGIYVSVALIGIPLYFTSEVVQVQENEGCAERFPSLHNQTAYQLQFSSYPHLAQLNFWIFNLCSKIVPAAILSLMTLLILQRLKQIRELSSRFASVKRDQQHQRTTKMILIIMFVFIVVELPQGILAVVSTIVPNFNLVYVMGDLNEMLTLLTSCIIFGLFCMMNGKIRSALLNTRLVAAIVKYRRWWMSHKITRGIRHEKLLAIGVLRKRPPKENKSQSFPLL